MIRTITELGVCDSFNSALASHLTPTFFINNKISTQVSLFKVNYLDPDIFAMINQMEGSDV